MENLVYIALFAPFASSLFAALFGMSQRQIFVGVVASALLFTSFVSSVLLAAHLYMTDEVIHVTMMDWIHAGDFNVAFGFVIDQISVTMMTVVTLVSTVVHIYAIGYMDHDKSFNRFFSYLSAFVFSMLILVMSDNFLGLFIGWEGVGVCSWLLIGFWYHKPDVSREENPSISPSWAANEAFIVNRIADLGMLVGIFILYWNTGTVKYDEVFAQVPYFGDGIIVTAAVALFIGAMGKSAQFPFHTWLTDAMEGPTPVSALIHAATMVTAGVFLVIRANPIFHAAPDVSFFIASLGTFVAFYAASMALVERDLKRIIAYSTLSQLGYMFAAAGLGAYWIALFHLAAHAFFKALLFLGGGNVMHAMHDELDIFKMGDLRKKMKGTWIYMTLASVALAGLPPLAGYWSKDAIIETAFNEHTYVLWIMLVVTAGMTAFYSFRQIFMTFHGEDRHTALGFHPHEMYKFVLIAMSPLAILATITGWFMEDYKEFIFQLGEGMHYEMSEHTHHMASYLGLIVLFFAISGIVLAYFKYARTGTKAWKRDEEKEQGFFYKLLKNQYYVPKFYEEFITKPYAIVSEIFWQKVDLKIVDATVDNIAKALYKTGDSTRSMQTGNLSNYLNWMAVGGVLLLVIAAISAMLV